MTQPNGLSTESPAKATSFSPTEPMISSLRQTKPWARFLSILGFLSIGFMVLSGIANMFFFPSISKEFGHFPVFITILTGTFNILFGLLYFFPSLFLFRYASSIGRLVNGGGVKEMEKALLNQKSFWKFVGIVCLIFIGFAVLGIVAAIVIPQFAK